ncbi:MAG: CsgG/HfaB family protein [Fibrobacterota bacterium]
MKNLHRISAILFFSALSLSAQAPALSPQSAGHAKKTNIAVMNLRAEGGLQSSAGILSDRLRAELFNTGMFQVMERGEMDNILKEQGFQQSGACDDKACIVEMGQLLGVEKILAGSIGQLGTVYLINLRVIDVKTGAMMDTYSGECRCPMEDLAGAMKTAAAYFTGNKPAPAAAPSPAPAVTVAAVQPEPMPTVVAAGAKPWSVNRNGVGVSWVVHNIDPEFNEALNFLRTPKPSRGLSLDSSGGDPSILKRVGFEIFYHKAIRQNFILRIAASRLSANQEAELAIIDTGLFTPQITSKVTVYNEIVQFPSRIGLSFITNPRRVRAQLGADVMFTLTNYSLEMNGNHVADHPNPALNINENIMSNVNVSAFAIGISFFAGLEVALGRHLGVGFVGEYTRVNASRFDGTGDISDLSRVFYGETLPQGEHDVVFSEAELPSVRDKGFYFFKNQDSGSLPSVVNINDASVDLSGGGFRLYTAWYF